MHAARPEYDAPAVRTADASDSGPQHPARYGQNDCEIALGRKNHLFAGSDGGGEHWAVIASLIETCKMNGVDPQAYLRDVLANIVARHPMSRIDELLPFAYLPAADKPLAGTVGTVGAVAGTTIAGTKDVARDRAALGGMIVAS